MTRPSQEREGQPGVLRRALLGMGLISGGRVGQRLADDGAISAISKELRDPNNKGLLQKTRQSASVPIVDATDHQALGGYIAGHNPNGFASELLSDLKRHAHEELGVKPGSVPLHAPHIVIGPQMSSSVIAHELGHASIDKSRVGRVLQSIPARSLFARISPISGVIGGITGLSDNENVRAGGIAASGLIAAPTLLSEAGASIKGYRHLKDLGATAEQLRLARKTLGSSFGTYAGSTAKGLGAAMVASQLSHAFKNREKGKESMNDDQPKLAFVEALPTLTGLATGYGPGRAVAGETAAALAPKGRTHRSENIARSAAVIGAPLGGLVAMGLARKYRLAPRLSNLVEQKFPRGLIAEPSAEQELVNLGVPGVAAITGSLAGGGLTGGLVGGIQRMRGPTHHREKEAALKPSPMWGTVGGQASKPAWRSQAGFTPTGMKTPTQRLQRSMGMGKVDGSKGLKPLDLGKLQEAAEGVKMGSVMLAITKMAAEPEKKPKVEGAGRLAAGGVGAALAGGVGTVAASTNALMNSAHEEAAEVAGDLLSKVEKTSPVPIYSGRGVPGGFYVPGGQEKAVGKIHAFMDVNAPAEAAKHPHILVGKQTAPSILAHEIGHADLANHRIGRLIQNRATMGLSKWKSPLSLATGLATGASSNEDTRRNGLIAAGALSIPQLAYEGAANVMGYRKLKRLGASPEQLRMARKTLLPAFGSYVGQAGAHLGVAALGSGIGRGIANLGREAPADKTAAEVPVRSEKEDEEFGDELEPQTAKAAEDFGGHEGFTVSQYSGVMNPPKLPYASGIPGWREPPVKTTSEQQKVGMLNPATQLAKAKAVGAPKLSTPPGPSIAQIAKPKGYGMPMSGAKKGNHTI